MKTLDQLQEELRENEALIADLERALAERPAWSDSLRLNISSLRKLQRDLEADFARAAAQMGVEICKYRLFADGGEKPSQEEPKISGLTSALNEFQTLFSLVFEALQRHEPKRTAHISPETVAVTSLRFGYAFAGSVGIVMTLPKELKLFDSGHDKAIDAVFNLARVQDPNDMLNFVQELGTGPIRSVYRWATYHVMSGLGADIEWRGSQLAPSHLLVQTPELQRLREIIELTSDTRQEEISIEGLLVQADLERLTFRITPERGDEIHGSAAKGAFDIPQGVTLDRMYRCKILRTTVARPSMDVDDISHLLLNLERI